ncbi:serpin B6-like [Tropilaelaps mercedesae]|uniref:Serpin B6-like n=1 Tax=Tropilaelaps mercedesae TaxID=418985 RepID=A0A1V9WZV5_9ACAR|nr:serpin B6-like [Tropilaelaps mercedesae]
MRLLSLLMLRSSLWGLAIASLILESVRLPPSVASELTDARRLKRKLSIANNNFALNVMRLLPAKKNIVLSPFCLSIALGMLYVGAGPSTARKMAPALQYVSTNLQEEDVAKGFEYLIDDVKLTDSGYTMINGEAVFFEAHEVNPNYVSMVTRQFRGHVQAVNFTAQPTEAKNAINSWVRNSTKGLVSSFLRRPVVRNNTRLVSMSVVYFRGFWSDGFQPNETYIGEFLNLGTTAKNISIMKKVDRNAIFVELKRLNATMLKLEYWSDASMVFILPENPETLDRVESRISPMDIFSGLRGATVSSVDIHLPKFEIEASYNMQEALLKSGMIEAFSQLDSDFSGISETDGSKMTISRVSSRLR